MLYRWHDPVGDKLLEQQRAELARRAATIRAMTKAKRKAVLAEGRRQQQAICRRAAAIRTVFQRKVAEAQAERNRNQAAILRAVRAIHQSLHRGA